jgi:hypothetical protein
MRPQPLDYHKSAPRRPRTRTHTWALVAAVLALLGLGVMPSTTEPGWGTSLFFWAAAAAAIAVHVALLWKSGRIGKR